jgi:hypothetical protein
MLNYIPALLQLTEMKTDAYCRKLIFVTYQPLHRGGERGWATAQGLVCLTSVSVCIGIAFYPHIVSVVCLIHVLLSETDNNGEEIEEVFDKSLWRVNGNFLNHHHQ